MQTHNINRMLSWPLPSIPTQSHRPKLKTSGLSKGVAIRKKERKEERKKEGEKDESEKN